MEKKLYTKEWLWLSVAIVVFLVNQLPFLSDVRPVMYDESWYGNTAYNFAQGDGFLNTVVGTRGNSNFLLPLLTAGFMRIFGYNLLAIRLPAVFCGLLTLVFLSLCMKQMRMEWKPQALTFLMFVSLTIFNTIFRFGRPECLAIMCTLGGIWFYLKYLERESWQNMLGLSVFVWLAGCAHPYALLLFGFLGIHLSVRTAKVKDMKGGCRLALLILAAVASVLAVAWVSKIYNGAEESYVRDRFSAKDIWLAVPVYFKEAFLSKASLSFLPLMAILVVESFRDKKIQGLAWAALGVFLLFPFLFSTDLMMVGMGLDYVAAVGMVLTAPFFEKVLSQKKRWVTLGICACCLGCLGISYYFNYRVKYEKANSVLAEELPSIIPKNSKVFGPLRQWPMLMQTDYQSEHTVQPIEDVETYDFFILNTQDTTFYSTYDLFLPVDESKMELVYEKPTRQYGMIQVFKIKH